LGPLIVFALVLAACSDDRTGPSTEALETRVSDDAEAVMAESLGGDDDTLFDRLSAELEPIIAAIEVPSPALTAVIGEYELLGKTSGDPLLLPCRVDESSSLGGGHRYSVSGAVFGNQLLWPERVTAAEHLAEIASSELGCVNPASEKTLLSIDPVTIGGASGYRFTTDGSITTQVDMNGWIAQGTSLDDPAASDALVLVLVEAANR